MIVAIDGPAGAGKSTVAREVARRLGAAYLDTGAMYRALTLLALRARRRARPTARPSPRSRARHPVEIVPTGDGDRVRVDGEDVTAEIRTPEVAAQVSEVSAHPGVREQMVAAQRALMSRGDWVSDGRDVGQHRAARRRRQGLPHREPGGARAPPVRRARRRRRRARRGPGAGGRPPPRRAGHHRGRRARCAWPHGAVVIDSSDLDAGDVADRVMSLVAALAAGG